MTHNNDDKFTLSCQENFLELQRKTKTNNQVKSLQLFPEINDTYSPTEIQHYIIPKIKECCNMDRIPVYDHTDSRKSTWKYRHLLNKEVNNLMHAQYLYKFKTANNVTVPLTKTIIQMLNKSKGAAFYDIALDLRRDIIIYNLRKELIHLSKCYNIIENAEQINVRSISSLPSAPSTLKIPTSVQFVQEILFGTNEKHTHKIRLNLSIAGYDIVNNEVNGWKDMLGGCISISSSDKASTLIAHPYYQTKEQRDNERNIKWTQMQIETDEIKYLNNAITWYKTYLEHSLEAVGDCPPAFTDICEAPPSSYLQYMSEKKQNINYKLEDFGEYTHYKNNFKTANIKWKSKKHVIKHLRYFVHCMNVKESEQIILTAPLIDLQLKLIHLISKYGFWKKSNTQYKEIESKYIQSLCQRMEIYDQCSNEEVDSDEFVSDDDCYFENFFSASNE
eukprot:102417_1